MNYLLNLIIRSDWAGGILSTSRILDWNNFFNYYFTFLCWVTISPVSCYTANPLCWHSLSIIIVIKWSLSKMMSLISNLFNWIPRGTISPVCRYILTIKPCRLSLRILCLIIASPWVGNCYVLYSWTISPVVILNRIFPLCRSVSTPTFCNCCGKTLRCTRASRRWQRCSRIGHYKFSHNNFLSFFAFLIFLLLSQWECKKDCNFTDQHFNDYKRFLTFFFKSNNRYLKKNKFK